MNPDQAPAKITISSIKYDPSGYVSMQWAWQDGVQLAGCEGYAIQISYFNGAVNFDLPDPASSSVEFPLTMTPGLDYSVRLSPYNAQGSVFYGSGAVAAIPFNPGNFKEGMAIASPTPASPVVIGASFEMSATVGNSAATGVGWIAWGDERTNFDYDTSDVNQGVAENTLELAADHGDGTCVVSVFDATDASGGGHSSVLYAVVDAKAQIMSDKQLALPARQPTTNANFVVKATVVVTDTATNLPVSGLKVYWTGVPNPPTFVYDEMLNPMTPGDGDDAAKYYTETDVNGTAVSYIGNTRPTIINFLLGLQSGFQTGVYVVFSNLMTGDSTTKNPWDAPMPADGTSVDLDKYESTVPIVVDGGIRASRIAQQMAILLNGVAAVGGVPSQLIGTDNVVQVPKKYFRGNGASNHIGVITTDVSGNGTESHATDFTATGAPAPAEPLPNVQRTLTAPNVPGVGSVVNLSTIANGLVVRVPGGTGLREGATVAVSIYLNGNWPHSVAARSDMATQPHTVQFDEVRNGFSVVFDESVLVNYDSGTIQADYTSTNDGQTSYSKIYQKSLSTVEN